MIRRSLATLTFLAVATVSAVAQIPGFPQIPTVDYNPILFINPAVKKELRLTPAASSKIQSVFFEEAQKVLPTVLGTSSGKPLPQAERTKRTMAAVRHMELRLASLLNPAQKARMRQLTLQSIGPSAALQPKVAAQLGLSVTQKKRLVDAVAEANEAMAARLQKGISGQDLRSRMPEITRIQNEAKARGNRALLTILTPAQKTKWNAMLGKPMNLSGLLGAPAMGIGG